jgi:hypothetical protein
MMICRVFTGKGPTLEDATKEAEQQANEELKVLPNMEAVALSANYHCSPYDPNTYMPQRYEFVITVLYQKKERRT